MAALQRLAGKSTSVTSTGSALGAHTVIAGFSDNGFNALVEVNAKAAFDGGAA